jgi:hypothetical protein
MTKSELTAQEVVDLPRYAEVVGRYSGLLRRDGEEYLVVSAKKELLIRVEKDELSSIKRQLGKARQGGGIAVIRAGDVRPELRIRLLPIGDSSQQERRKDESPSVD